MIITEEKQELIENLKFEPKEIIFAKISCIDDDGNFNEDKFDQITEECQLKEENNTIELNEDVKALDTC